MALTNWKFKFTYKTSENSQKAKRVFGKSVFKYIPISKAQKAILMKIVYIDTPDYQESIGRPTNHSENLAQQKNW